MFFIVSKRLFSKWLFLLRRYIKDLTVFCSLKMYDFTEISIIISMLIFNGFFRCVCVSETLQFLPYFIVFLRYYTICYIYYCYFIQRFHCFHMTFPSYDISSFFDYYCVFNCLPLMPDWKFVLSRKYPLSAVCLQV